MGLEDFFEKRQRIQGNYKGYDDDDDYGYPVYRRHSYHEKVYRQKWLVILDRIRSSKKLRLLVAAAAIVVLMTAVILVVVLLPFILKLFDYIGHNGLRGLSDAITGFLDKLLKGSGK
ncbi:MAG: hypothetical protein NTU98_14470 [Bacteroidetes bacterium]|nr:hypothetical protein [Bacteroidota bacterium]